MVGQNFMCIYQLPLSSCSAVTNRLAGKTRKISSEMTYSVSSGARNRNSVDQWSMCVGGQVLGGGTVTVGSVKCSDSWARRSRSSPALCQTRLLPAVVWTHGLSLPSDVKTSLRLWHLPPCLCAIDCLAPRRTPVVFTVVRFLR